jgi:zinc and cadmium transporter
MNKLEIILILSLIGSVGALAGGALLLLGKKASENIVHVLVSFAAGALLGVTFLELLPEAIEHAEETLEATGTEINVFLWTLGGMLFFYLLDRGIHWFQYHQKINKGRHGSVNVPLVILGDSAHNFIDGVAIAVTYLVNPGLGVVTAIATIAHEVPQEIGDFAILLHEGLSKKRVLLINISSALLSVLGAVIAILIGERIEGIIPYALSLTAGFFLYIALTNLLPEIHSEEKKGYAFAESSFVVLGVLAIWLAVSLIPHAG